MEHLGQAQIQRVAIVPTGCDPGSGGHRDYTSA
jgi:hypothetical protein